jgi:HSP20 family protein
MEEETKLTNIGGGDDNEVSVELAKSRQAAVEETETVNAFDDDFDDEGEGQLAIDVYQTKDSLVIEAPIAGVTDAENLDVSITTESVTIRGKREKETKVKEDDYFYQECYWGRFSRSIILPQEIDAEKAEATIKNGILIIKLPKLHRQKTKKLRVKFG